MARLALNKSSLNKERRNLQAFERFLPSLDLKRRQLMNERSKSAAAMRKTREEIKQLANTVGERVPMLGNEEVDLAGLGRIASIEHRVENVVGVVLPRLDEVRVEIRPYARLGRPAWTDLVAAELRRRLELEIRSRFERRRLAILEGAVRRITQRVNLFEKVLIPRTRESIRRIRIYLGDAERAGVVQAKLSKKKRVAEARP